MLAAAVAGLLLVVKAAPAIEDAFRAPPTDLGVDLATARAYLEHYSPFTPEGAVRSGVAVWGPSGNGHPPSTSFWALPLADLEPPVASAVLGSVTMLLLLIELCSTLLTLGCPSAFVTAWAALGFILGCSFMTTSHFAAGQLSGAIGFLYFLAWRAGRGRGGDGRAGVALGAACSMKLFPGVVVLMFLAARRWRAVIAAGATYVAIAGIMTARFGLQSWARFFSQQAEVAKIWMNSIENQSLHGIVQHAFRPVCAVHGPISPLAMAISIALSLGLIGVAMWWSRGDGQARPPSSFDARFGLFVVLSVVTSQWTWEHYTIIYALPVAILAAELVKAWRRAAGRPGSRISFAAMAALLAGIVASWRIDMLTKIRLQASVHAGNRADHLRLHVYDFLGWGPGLVLLACFFVVVGRPAHRWLPLRLDPRPQRR